MSSVASKNLFELLGNDPEEEPQPPTQPIDKPIQRHGKRNEVAQDTPKDTSSANTARGGGGRGGRGRGRGDGSASERAFQDRNTGRSANRDKPTDDGIRFDRHSDRLGGGRIQRGGSYDGRGGRGGAGGRGGRGGKDDRHSRSLHSDSQKQAGKGWGDESGTAEWNDEKAGQVQAWEEEKAGFDSFPDKPVNAEGENPIAENGDAAGEAAAPEPEDKSMSYADYLAQQAEKKLALGGSLEARKANEGSKVKAPKGTELTTEAESEYFVGGGGKKQRDRERKEKNTLVLDHDYAPRGEPTGGRGGGRGGRGRGGRGDRGDFRGDRRGGGPARGGPGGPRGGGFRGGPRGGTPNVGDNSAFPTLGS